MGPSEKTPDKGHHLILGTLTDFITGEVLDDTLDERYRQKIARLLVETKGFRKDEIIPRYMLPVTADDKKAVVPIDFLIRLNTHADQLKHRKQKEPQIEHNGDRLCEDEKLSIIIKFGPGSLVTRHQPTLAAARLISNVQIPLVIVTNGETANTLETSSGKILSERLENIPDRKWVLAYLAENPSRPVPVKAQEMAARIVYCFEVDGACSCDTSICKFE